MTQIFPYFTHGMEIITIFWAKHLRPTWFRHSWAVPLYALKKKKIKRSISWQETQHPAVWTHLLSFSGCFAWCAASFPPSVHRCIMGNVGPWEELTPMPQCGYICDARFGFSPGSTERTLRRRRGTCTCSLACLSVRLRASVCERARQCVFVCACVCRYLGKHPDTDTRREKTKHIWWFKRCAARL